MLKLTLSKLQTIIDILQHPRKSWIRVLFSPSAVSDSLRPHGLQHTRLPCPSPTPELDQTHLHWVGDAIQPSHPLSSPSPAFNLSQHQGLFQGVNSLHQAAEVSELQLHHQPFQRIFRTEFLWDGLGWSPWLGRKQVKPEDSLLF